MQLPVALPLPGIPPSKVLEMPQYWKYKPIGVVKSSVEECFAAYQRWAPLAFEVLGSTCGLIELEEATKAAQPRKTAVANKRCAAPVSKTAVKEASS